MFIVKYRKIFNNLISISKTRSDFLYTIINNEEHL